MKVTKLFIEFFSSEKSGGLVLIFCTIFSLAMANSPAQHAYINFWQLSFQGHTITQWINDGLMAIFFLLIGLELEREIYAGELSNIRNALLPTIAAVGGVLVPAAIYLVFNYGTNTQSGAGIPMATDIAFAIGMLALLGSRVPASLKVFLTALAVIDDLCAIMIIAIFYSSGISFIYLGLAIVTFLLMCLCNRLKLISLWLYIPAGILMWYFMLLSGVHATIAGVLLAFAIPFGKGDEHTPSWRLQHYLHKPVAFFIVPLFAMANTAIMIKSGWHLSFATPEAGGIIIGLVMGKPLGILLFSFFAVKLGACMLPRDLRWKHLLGAGLLAGIGFTMSIFVALLAFKNEQDIDTAKMAIIAASIIASVAGLVVLNFILSRQPAEKSHEYNEVE